MRMERGFAYLTAVMDWVSRYVLAWRLSQTLDVAFCLEAVEEALSYGRPEIFNTDQGAQFTSDVFTGRLDRDGIQISPPEAETVAGASTTTFSSSGCSERSNTRRCICTTTRASGWPRST